MQAQVQPLTQSGTVRPATLIDVAMRAGVSKSTAAKVCRGDDVPFATETREAVLQAARELGYRPNPHAQRLRRPQTRRVVPLFAPLLDSGFNTQKLEGIQAILNAAEIDAPIHACGFHNQTGGIQAEMLAHLQAQRPHAIVCSTMLLKDEAVEEMRRWVGEGGVAVTYDSDFDLGCDHVIFDRYDAGYQATRHLLDLGHTRIGYAHHSPAEGDDDRQDGVIGALRDSEVAVRKDWMLRADESIDFEVGGVKLANQFLALPKAKRPTALVIVNDLVTLSFMEHVQASGVRVPSDLSIVAHDDRPFARYAAVPLSAVTHPAKEIAARVAELLLTRLNDTDEVSSVPRRVVVRGNLIVRASSAPLK